MNRHMVFVYGTLKTGEPNHHMLFDSQNGFSEFFAKAQTVDAWPLVIASKYNIPFLLHKRDFGKKIIGEIYLFDDKMLAKIDDMESHPTFYTREETSVRLENGSTRIVWSYFVHNFNPKLLDLPTLDDYANDGEHGLRYSIKFEQDQTVDNKVDGFVPDVKLFL